MNSAPAIGKLDQFDNAGSGVIDFCWFKSLRIVQLQCASKKRHGKSLSNVQASLNAMFHKGLLRSMLIPSPW
jgi:hypothetical protein